jgi:hypothetical protein
MLQLCVTNLIFVGIDENNCSREENGGGERQEYQHQLIERTAHSKYQDHFEQ